MADGPALSRRRFRTFLSLAATKGANGHVRMMSMGRQPHSSANVRKDLTGFLEKAVASRVVARAATRDEYALARASLTFTQ